MLPTIELFGRMIPTYGLCGCMGGLLGLLFIGVRSSHLHVDTENAIYIYVLGLVGMLVGAKGLYLLLELPGLIRNFSLLWTDFNTFFSMYFSGGMVFYGGFFGAVLVAWLTARSYHVRLKDYFPVLLPAVALMSAFGRIGCFCAGCCYGKETDSFLGVVFPDGAIAPAGVSLVPVQLFEAGFDFLLFVFMIALVRTRRESGSAPVKNGRPAAFMEIARGHLLATYVYCYALIRFVLEFWRGDAVRGHFLCFSTSQWISLAALIFLTLFWIRLGNRGKRLLQNE